MLPVILRGAFSDVSGYGSLCRYMARALHSAGVRPAIHDIRCKQFSSYVPSSADERSVLDGLRSQELPDPMKSLVLDVTTPSLFNHCFLADAGYSMTECTRIPARWTTRCLKMDAVFVPGPFGKSVFEACGFLKVTEVAPGFDTEAYRWVPEDMFNVWGGIGPEPFKFVVTGHLMHSINDRKGIKQLVRCFAREFRDDPDVGLILKTQVLGHDFSDRVDLMDILRSILDEEKFPAIQRISVLHRNYTSAELATIYSHPSIRAFVSPTCGEGIAYNMLECASCGGVPVIATNFSEHTNFLPADLFIPLPCRLVPIPEEYHAAPESPYPKEASWAFVSDEDLMETMRSFHTSESGHPRKPVPGEIMPGLSLEAFGTRLARALETVVPGSRMRQVSDEIQIGSGTDPVDGWFHIEEDAMGSRDVEVACDPRRIPLMDASYGEAMIYGILDEMSDEDAARAAYECFRMLRPGGIVRLVVTDAETVMRTILDTEESLTPHAFNYLSGFLTDKVNLWTKRRVLKLLRMVGFDNAMIENPDPAEAAVRPSDLVAGRLIGGGVRISMVARAVKPV